MAPNLSRLELGLTDQVYRSFLSVLTCYVSKEWESLCRRSVPMAHVNNIEFGPAARWWGPGMNRQPIEFDIVAESSDKKSILIGESKWSFVENPVIALKRLRQKAELLPLAAGKKIITVLFIKGTSEKEIPANVFLPSDVLERLR